MTHDYFDPVGLEEAAAILRTGNYVTVRAPDSYILPDGQLAWEKGEAVTFAPVTADQVKPGRVVLYAGGGTYFLGVVKQVERGVARISAPHAELSTEASNVLGQSNG